MITDPTGVLEPPYLGAHFFDQQPSVFYQARGRTAADWHFVPPTDFVGSFVKIYDFFVGVPADDPKEPEVHRIVADAQKVRETMRLCGLEIVGFGGLRWKAGPLDVFQIRLRFNRLSGLSLFAGFAAETKAWAMPTGVGFTLEDDALTFGESTRRLREGDVLALRIEVAFTATAYVNDERFGTAFGVVPPLKPVVALFDRAPGPRPVAPGYEAALKRNMEC